jgi:hypothetical protein
MARKRLVLAAAIAAALGFFVLGWLASRLFNEGPARPTHAAAGETPPRDAGPAEPILLIDASIDLLPGKTLRIDPPAKPEIPPR